MAEISGNVAALALSKQHRRLAAAIAERRSVLLTVSRYSVTAGRNGGLVDTDACSLHPKARFCQEPISMTASMSFDQRFAGHLT
jgi:hypothetical protein